MFKFLFFKLVIKRYIMYNLYERYRICGSIPWFVRVNVFFIDCFYDIFTYIYKLNSFSDVYSFFNRINPMYCDFIDILTLEVKK